MLENYFGPEIEKWPKPLQHIKYEEMDLAMISLGMTISFLSDALIDEKMIKTGNYHLYNPETRDQFNGINCMILDA